MTLTLGEARDLVMQLHVVKGDSENAHLFEDELRHKVLEAIANGAPHPEQLAMIALSTSRVPFERWYA